MMLGAVVHRSGQLDARIVSQRRFHVGRSGSWLSNGPTTGAAADIRAARATMREFDQALVADDASHEAHHRRALRNLIAAPNKAGADSADMRAGLKLRSASTSSMLPCASTLIFSGGHSPSAIRTSRSDLLMQMT